MTPAQIAARLRECAALGKPDGHMKLATTDLYAAADLLERHAEDAGELRHKIRMLKTVLHAILDADERGQGLPFAIAMQEAAIMVGRLERGP